MSEKLCYEPTVQCPVCGTIHKGRCPVCNPYHAMGRIKKVRR